MTLPVLPSSAEPFAQGECQTCAAVATDADDAEGLGEATNEEFSADTLALAEAAAAGGGESRRLAAVSAGVLAGSWVLSLALHGVLLGGGLALVAALGTERPPLAGGDPAWRGNGLAAPRQALRAFDAPRPMAGGEMPRLPAEAAVDLAPAGRTEAAEAPPIADPVEIGNPLAFASPPDAPAEVTETTTAIFGFAPAPLPSGPPRPATRASQGVIVMPRVPGGAPAGAANVPIAAADNPSIAVGGEAARPTGAPSNVERRGDAGLVPGGPAADGAGPPPKSFVPARAVTRGRGVGNGVDGRGLPVPGYPALSQRRGESGTVELRVEVLPDGRAGEVTVVSDPGFPRLVAAALEAARAARFAPATAGDEATASTLIIPFRFVLN